MSCKRFLFGIVLFCVQKCVQLDEGDKKKIVRAGSGALLLLALVFASIIR